MLIDPRKTKITIAWAETSDNENLKTMESMLLDIESNSIDASETVNPLILETLEEIDPFER